MWLIYIYYKIKDVWPVVDFLRLWHTSFAASANFYITNVFIYLFKFNFKKEEEPDSFIMSQPSEPDCFIISQPPTSLSLTHRSLSLFGFSISHGYKPICNLCFHCKPHPQISNSHHNQPKPQFWTHPFAIFSNDHHCPPTQLQISVYTAICCNFCWVTQNCDFDRFHRVCKAKIKPKIMKTMFMQESER